MDSKRVAGATRRLPPILRYNNVCWLFAGALAYNCCLMTLAVLLYECLNIEQIPIASLYLDIKSLAKNILFITLLIDISNSV